MSRSRTVAVCVAGLALAGVAFAAPAGAATRHAKPHPLIVTAGPIRQLVNAQPGKSVAVQFRLTDLATEPVKVTGTEGAFTETPDGHMVPAQPSPGESDWLRFPPAVVLYPQRQVTITAHVVLPEHAQPGDADLAGVFATRPVKPLNSPGAHVVTVPTVLLQVIVAVPGKASRHVTYGLAGGGFTLGGPVTLTATATEHGTDYALLNHQSLTGAGTVRLPGMLLLADSTRTVAVQWQPPSWCLGCTMHYGTASATVWAVPGLQLLGIVLVLAAIGGVVFLLRRNSRRARRRRHSRVPVKPL